MHRVLSFFLRSRWGCPSLILFLTIAKLVYAFTRPVFLSGPDSNAYIPMAEDIWEQGFLSSQIAGLPVYPIGYGLFLSPMTAIGDKSWYLLAQSVQALLFSFASFLLLKVVSNYFSRSIALLTFVVFLFHPALFTASTQAMYESLLIPTIILIYYASIKLNESQEKRRFLWYCFLPALIGFALVVHPRVLFLMLPPLALIAVNLKTIFNYVLALLCLLLAPISMAVRNFYALDQFTLSTATKYAFGYGHESIGICETVSCYYRGVKDNFLEFLVEFIRNFSFFFTPYSGSMKRGTWFHNLSIYTFLERNDLALVASFAAIAFSIFILVAWIAGLISYSKKSWLTSMISFLIVLLLALTDGLVYGDSRHRLIAVPFMLPFQITGALLIFARFRKSLLQAFRSRKN
jgi:hypothetical protein